MSFLTQAVTIPMWFLIMMNIIAITLLGSLLFVVNRFRRGEFTKEEHSDMVVWQFKTTKRPATPKKPAIEQDVQKKQEKKQDLVQVLKILLREGEKGVFLQTITDRMGTNRANAQRAMENLVEKKLVNEVVGMSGTKYYLTPEGRDYCKRKSR